MPTAQYKNPRNHVFRAKELRRQSPLCERLLWDALRELKKQTGWKFRRQQPLAPYIADFICPAVRLVIELDGPSHDTRQSYDAKRTSDLAKMGWTVIRFTNDDVRENIENVTLAIIAKIKELSV